GTAHREGPREPRPQSRGARTRVRHFAGNALPVPASRLTSGAGGTLIHGANADLVLREPVWRRAGRHQLLHWPLFQPSTIGAVKVLALILAAVFAAGSALAQPAWKMQRGQQRERPQERPRMSDQSRER